LEVQTNKTYVFKVGNEYLESVFEPFSEEDDDCNWTFTKKLSKARNFYSLDGEYVAPKYLWIDKEERNASTAEDLCNFFSGDFVEILITEKWEELREISLKS
jgi:hypothetical protein